MSRRQLLAAAAAAILAAGGLYAGLPRAELVEIYPREGMLPPGGTAHLEVVVRRPWYDLRPVSVEITRGLSAEPVARLQTRGGTLTWTPTEPGGYGVTARLAAQQRSTALDVGESWVTRPRYGFLTDFGPEHAGLEERFAQMARFHLNGLQFYDWHYRHSDYLPPGEQYRDPLGRLLSRRVLLARIEAAHRHGMAAMAYTTVYAAPREFFKQHPDWALYDHTGEPLRFGDDFLYIMNPEPGGPWAAHMLREYSRIVTELPFDGIHLDQFGSPRVGYRRDDGALVDVATAMAHLLDETKRRISPRPVLFNDVGGWPLKDTAPTAKDAVYVEVWPPHVHFQHLHELIEEGRERSGGKPVILAAYISPAFAPSVLLTDAVIFASGGYHLEIGEGLGMLHDPYFPNHRQMDADLAEHLRRYYDVIVRYQDLLYDRSLEGWAPAVSVEGSRVLPGAYFNGVWPLGRQNDRYGVLHLINLNGLEDARWNSPRTAPPPVLEDRLVTVEIAEPPGAVYLIDPDGPDQSPRPLPFTYQDGRLSLTLDRLAYWSILVLEK